MTVRDMESALQDVELDCAFAIFYFVGTPHEQLAKQAQAGVVGWAHEHWPGLMKLTIEGVEHVLRTTLEQMDAQTVELPGGELTPEELCTALSGITEMHTGGVPLPPPESGVDWEPPNLNNPDGSDDFETEP